MLVSSLRISSAVPLLAKRTLTSHGLSPPGVASLRYLATTTNTTTMGGRHSKPGQQRSPSQRAKASALAVDVPKEPAKAYDALAERLRELSSLNGIDSLLNWDEMVMMPPGAAASRGSQKATLAGIKYEKQTDPTIGALLAVLEAAPAGALTSLQSAVVREAAREYRKETALSKELAQRMAKLKTDAYTAWVKAKTENDFSVFAPLLQELIEVNKERARLIDPTRPAYDVLLDDYEKGLTSERLDQVFSQLRDGLVPLLAEIKSRGRKIDASWIKGDYDTDKQAELCNKIALDMGFDTQHGRLDVSVHPFSIGMHPNDVRMTTRFKKDDVIEAISGAVHETGHALYEQGRSLAAEAEGLPVNGALSMGLHESQSLLWERCERFPAPFGPASADSLYEAMNVIQEPSLVRVEADELTYPLHIILRYELERGLIDGSIAVEDVPRLWNDRMEAYLGARPPSDAKGCLQDVHWSMGAFGYFPTYTLGALYAVQLYDAAARELPGLEDKIRAGEFAPLRAWLREKIHQVGSLPANGDELMAAVTGSPLDPSVFLSYAKAKYGKLYGL
ncbi:hypothetical protein GPECTOR_15g317 [Gonium pectorale]|uniref:Carboxypeptidase n=1 Tax=Gonium pectorale TaxID=33097 RepID=A0A150GLC9_GONPE|nr:hypothetical protein GPECTOR_15g317 [Gonium pectorale]|eukprot:KXZ50633.1 hypothetical protein GPECTOR_15g317 [Gonium pectorale]